MEDCLFCKIIDKNIPSSIVLEDDKVLAFLDINPVHAGHTLVVPKSHSANMLGDTIEDLSACMAATKKIGKALIDATGAQGFNVISNINKAAGQIIPHTHFHVIPRFEDDGLKHWPQKKYQDGEMETVLRKIVARLG